MNYTVITGAAIGFLAMLPFIKLAMRTVGPIVGGFIHGLLIMSGAAIGWLVS